MSPTNSATVSPKTFNIYHVSDIDKVLPPPPFIISFNSLYNNPLSPFDI